MTLREGIILFWALPSLLTLWFMIWHSRKDSDGIMLKDLMLILLVAIVWPIGVIVTIIEVVGDHWEKTAVPSYHTVIQKRKEKRGYDD